MNLSWRLVSTANVGPLIFERDPSEEDRKHQPKVGASQIPPQTLSYRATIDPSTILNSRKVNFHLVRSCALLAFDDPVSALLAADKALREAEHVQIYYLTCKSHLYRGLSLMQLGRWREASFAFSQAASVKGWALRVSILKSEAERRAAEEEGGGERLRVRTVEEGKEESGPIPGTIVRKLKSILSGSLEKRKRGKIEKGVTFAVNF